MVTKSSNKNLRNASKAKKDEFYTQLSDIEKELRHYKDYFKGKVVFCNCDDPRVSNFFHYFSYNFEQLGLKKLITTCYKNQNVDLFSQNNSEKAIYLEYTGDKNRDNVPNPEEIGIKHLKGDGDFRSKECIELLKQSDVVVTNPPFSLFREYVAQLVEFIKETGQRILSKKTTPEELVNVMIGASAGLQNVSKPILTKLAQATETNIISPLLKKLGVADNLIDDASKQIAKITDEKQISNILSDLGKVKIAPKIPQDLQPLAQKAVAEGKTVEEFMRDYDGGLILEREKVNNWISGGPENTVPVSELLGIEGKKFMKEMNLPDIPVRVQEAGEDTIGHYAQIEWRSGNRLKDARINIEISPTEEFGVESLGEMEKNLLHELAHAKQITLNRLGGKKIQGEISEQAAEKHANYILSKVKSQLTKAFEEAKGVKEITPPTPKIRPAVQEEFGQAGKLSQLTPEPKISEPLKPEILTSETLTKPYTETTKKAIIDTAEAVDEHPSVVSRVVDSLRKAKTSLVEYVQNADIRVRQLTEKKGIKIDDASDPYLKMTLYPGRVGTKVENLKIEAKGITDTMKQTANELKTDLGTVKKDVSDYLKFRHAPERNLALGEKAAGITTKEAQEGLKRIETSANGKKIKEIADKLQKINDQTLDILKESGVISDDLYKTLRIKYKYHIPLNRIFAETDDVGSVLSGKGFDVRTTGIKAAKGSEREVADIMTNILTNQEQAIIRAEKNIVDQATLAFTRQNKDILGDLMTEARPQAIGKTFEGKPLLERTQDPTILQLFENGKRVWIKIKNPELAIANL